jgi:hypothetical protein
MLRILLPTVCNLRSSYSTAFGFSCGGKAPNSGLRNLVALAAISTDYRYELITELVLLGFRNWSIRHSLIPKSTDCKRLIIALRLFVTQSMGTRLIRSRLDSATCSRFLPLTQCCTCAPTAPQTVITSATAIRMTHPRAPRLPQIQIIAGPCARFTSILAVLSSSEQNCGTYAFVQGVFRYSRRHRDGILRVSLLQCSY